MKGRTKIIIGAVLVAVLLAATGTAIAVNVGGDDDTPITGPALQQASDAAIAHLGGGTVTDTEIGDEESMYEVEVTLEDGTQVDVQLNELFEVVGTEADDESEDDDDQD